MSVLSATALARLLGRDAPTAEQQAVIEADLVPGLVVAGAGSGKTETMAGRVVWLLANGLVAPDQVLGLTFTRKAAGELEQRIRARLRRLPTAARSAGVELPGRHLLVGADGAGQVGLLRPTVATYNSYAASLVADHALRLGLEPASRLLGEAAQFQLAAQVVETWPDDVDVDNATSTVIDAVLALAGALAEHLLDQQQADAQLDRLVGALTAPPPVGRHDRPQLLRETIASLGARRRLLPLVAAYRAAKRAADAIDFGDQVALAARLAGEAPEVGAGERARFAVVLLDEYQDTSYAQVELLAALFGGGHPVTAVGDPHQSIYGWRGASAGGLARFPGKFPLVGGAPAPVATLATSWRNDHAVLAVANRTAAPLRAGAPVPVPELVARPHAGPGRVRARVVATSADEAADVARFVDEQTAVRRATGLPATAAVLCRRRAQFEPIAAALRARGLRVQVVGLGGLLSSPEVVDLVAALQVAHDPGRGDAMVRLLTGARTRLGAADLHALGEWADALAARGDPGRERRLDVPGDAVDGASLAEAVAHLPPPGWRSRLGRPLTEVARARLTELAGVLTAVRASAQLPLPELVDTAERLLELDLEVAALPGVPPGRSRAQLDAFADVAAQFAGSGEQASLGAFLAWLEAADAAERGLELPVVEVDPQAVQVCTVHAAKGLEWDVVAVPGLVDGTFPATAALRSGGPRDKGWLTALATLPFPLRGDRGDLPALDLAGAGDAAEVAARLEAFTRANGAHQVDEERRLAYVAFTRARCSLLLSAAYWDGSAKTSRAVSPFLTELCDAGLVEVECWAEEPTGPNPTAALVRTARWPADPFDPDPSVLAPVASGGASPPDRPAAPTVSRRAAVQAAADAVLTLLETDPAGPPPDPDDPDQRLADQLLAEQAERGRPVREVALPPHLSASALVHLAADRDAFALDLRRPVPVAPSSVATRGTAFHAWVEAFFGRASLVDVDDLPGADDEAGAPGLDTRALRETFLRTPWAQRAPLAVETDVETVVGGVTVRARIDAVFPDHERPDVPGAVVVVDWKTGVPPADPVVRSARELQLAVYRLAWARHTGVAPDLVRAAFCYVATGTTVEPAHLPDEVELARLLATP